MNESNSILAAVAASVAVCFRCAVIICCPIGAALAVLTVSVMACSSPDFSGPSINNPAQLPWRLSLSAHAITMDTLAPYDTLRLTATTAAFDGSPFVNAPPVTYTSLDSSVRVSATGLLTARSPHSAVKIIASVVDHGIGIADTAIVNVTASATRPVFDSLQLSLKSGDSAKIAVPNFLSPQVGFPSGKQLLVGAFDDQGKKIPNAIVALRASDVLQAGWEGATLSQSTTTTASTSALKIATSARPGVPVTIYASATVYGVTHEDSLQILITPELVFAYTLIASPPPSGTTPVITLKPDHQEIIGVGGVVWWVNSVPTDSLDIVFDDPTAASVDDIAFPSGQGNIDPFPGGDFLNTGNPDFIRSRRFLRAGTFHFHSTRTGASGMVIVQ